MSRMSFYTMPEVDWMRTGPAAATYVFKRARQWVFGKAYFLV